LPYTIDLNRRYVVSNSNKYKNVLTLSVFGINRRMLGLKISLFSLEDCIEQGVFINPTQADWDFRGPDKMSKIKMSVENLPFSEYIVT